MTSFYKFMTPFCLKHAFHTTTSTTLTSSSSSIPNPTTTNFFSKQVSQWIRYTLHYTPRIVGWTSVFIFLLDTGCSITSIEGRSMQPTLNPDSNRLKKDIILLEKNLLWSKEWQRGDIIIFKSPSDPSQKHIAKRIIALENDLVILDPTCPYAQKHHLLPTEAIQIPKGHCWIEGDNVSHSIDSKTFGPVPLALIIAKATAIVWPPSRIQFLKNHVPAFSSTVVASTPSTFH